MPFHPHIADAPKPLVTPIPQAPQVIAPNRGTLSSAHVAVTDAFFAHWSLAEWIGYSALVALSILLTIVAIRNLVWMLHAWRTNARLGDSGLETGLRPPRRSFSLLVPVRHEGVALIKTLDQLAQQDYPDFEVLAIVGNDDPATALVAREAAGMYPDIIRVVIDESHGKNRPKALNRGLQDATGAIVGVFNAGDDVPQGLLRLVDSRFSETAADIVQGGVQLGDFQSSWWSLRSALQNYFWFRSGLELRAKSRSAPLEDNTVFVKRRRLAWARGWNEESVAEDYDLGVRLGIGGAKVVVAYSRHVVTREKNPQRIASFFTQQTRSNLGSLQVLGNHGWRALPFVRQRVAVRSQLVAPFLQPAAALLIPVAVVAALLLGAPAPIILITLIPLAVALVSLTVEVTALGELARFHDQNARARDYGALILGTLPYQAVLAAASVRALATPANTRRQLRHASPSSADREVFITRTQSARPAR